MNGSSEQDSFLISKMCKKTSWFGVGGNLPFTNEVNSEKQLNAEYNTRRLN